MNLFELFPLNSRNHTDDCVEHPIVFVERFWRWRDSLFVVALRVLGDRRAATEVVEACFRRACQQPPKFESDGAFGSWVLRILLDQALQERRRQKGFPKGHSHQGFASAPWNARVRHWVDDFWCLETTV